MNDEEKKAFQYYKECNEKDLENYEYLHEECQKQTKYLEILLNLIEKQSKEIEELKDKCKELIFEKQELTSALLDSTPNDKIKAKIDYLKTLDFGTDLVTQSTANLTTICILSEFLEDK